MEAARGGVINEGVPTWPWARRVSHAVPIPGCWMVAEEAQGGRRDERCIVAYKEKRPSEFQKSTS